MKTHTLLATLSLGVLLPGCSPTYHVLADDGGRPVRIYEDALSCQFSAVWHSNRGMHGAECFAMSEAELLFRGVDIDKIGASHE